MRKTSTRTSKHRKGRKRETSTASAAMLCSAAIFLSSSCTLETAVAASARHPQPQTGRLLQSFSCEAAAFVGGCARANARRCVVAASAAAGDSVPRFGRSSDPCGKNIGKIGTKQETLQHTMPSAGSAISGTFSRGASTRCGRGLAAQVPVGMTPAESGDPFAAAAAGSASSSMENDLSNVAAISGQMGLMNSTLVPTSDPNLVSDILQIAGDSTATVTAAATQVGEETTVADMDDINRPPCSVSILTETEAALPGGETADDPVVVDIMASDGTIFMEGIDVSTPESPPSTPPRSVADTYFSPPVPSGNVPTSDCGGGSSDGRSRGGALEEIIEVISLPGSTYENNAEGCAGDDEGCIVEGEMVPPAPHDVFNQEGVNQAPETSIVKGEPVYGEKNSRAMVTELVVFTVPLLVVWLSNPIMSLVDTAVVGAKSSVELAALGPGTSLCDNVAFMCGFLAQVTTNLGASALASGDEYKADRATLTGMMVSLVVGLGVSHALLEHGAGLVKLMVGDNPAVSSILPFSNAYVCIRAMGFAAVTMSMVLQGAYLAKKDVATPIKSIAGASIVNLVLDCVTVFGMGMGIRGAALSTTAAQWAGLLYLVKKVLPDLRRSGALSFLPTWPELKKFVALGVPTLVALTGQVATCMAVTFAASGCDTVALAAHQVIYGVFVLFCPIGEAVSQTVQTYLPGFTVKRPVKADGNPRRTVTFGKSAVRMLSVVSGVALVLGATNGLLATLLTTALPSVFTRDPAVWAAMRSVSPLCGLTVVLHAFTATLQGTMMATKDVYSMAAIYTACSTFFCSLFFMMRRHSAATLKLTSVWQVFVVYQIARCTLFASNVAWTHRHSFKEHIFPQHRAVESPTEAAAKIDKAEAMLSVALPTVSARRMRSRHSLFSRPGEDDADKPRNAFHRAMSKLLFRKRS